ncbi:MAG: GNAT family N-acetyltransferase [Burkholderiaceae bacterium]
MLVRIESPRQEDVLALLSALDAYLEALYPPASNHILPIEALCAPHVRFFVARDDAAALGCGALLIGKTGYAEVKRMFVAPDARGRGVGRQILRCIEERAVLEGLTLSRLETGIHQPEALALYRASGYAVCAPFGQYRADPLSVFMEKRLQ